MQQDGLDMANQHLARVEAFFEEGMVSEFDLLRARALLIRPPLAPAAAKGESCEFLRLPE